MSTDRVFHALSDQTRRALLERMQAGPVPAGRLASGFAMSRPAVTKHLRVLVDAGLVHQRKEGRRRLYGLAPGGIDHAQAWIQHATEFWNVALSSFKRYTEEER